jgi:uncharacterized protein
MGTMIQSYASWVQRHASKILAISLLIAVFGVVLARRLPLHSDLSSLLPSSAPSVRDLNALQKRARAFGTVFVVVDAPSAAALEAVRPTVSAALAKLPPTLVANVTADSAVARRFFWEQRFLFVSLTDLIAARDALVEKIRAAKLTANPLYVSLDDSQDNDDAVAIENQRKLEDLQQRLRDAQRDADDPGLLQSQDGKTALYILQSTFPSSDAVRSEALLAQLRSIQQQLQKGPIVTRGLSRPLFGGGATEFTPPRVARTGPAETTRIFLTGTVTVSSYERASVLDGMATAAIVTVLLCGIALWLFYRSGVAVMAVLWSLAVGVIATFALTWLWIGELNIMSAFLTAIVVGNGINAGLMVLARYFEEYRASGETSDKTVSTIQQTEVLARTLAGALPGTLAATVTALLAYGSLTLTEFRGFRHFGIIAAIGMASCWVTAFTVLPAALSLLSRRGLLRIGKQPQLGRWIVRLLPFSARSIAVGGIAVMLVTAVVAGRFILRDPFLKDWRDLQSNNAAIDATRVVDERLKATFDPKLFQGLSNRLVIAFDDAAEVEPIVQSLRALEAKRAPGSELLMEIRSVADLVPINQDKKIVLLNEIRDLLDEDSLAGLTDDEQQPLLALRPPPHLTPFVFANVPTELSWPFVEQDGSIGKLILLKGASRFRTWMVDDRLEFARDTRALPLPANAHIGGEALVIADIIDVMERDTPLMVGFALLGAIVTIGALVGFRRHGLVTLFSGVLGITAMIACCALLDLRVHFLDLIALPITIGIGIEYAVNITTRDRQDEREGKPASVVLHTGAAVLLCSFTTIVGYGSLLLSSNGGIRSFGLAAMIGEVTCVGAALLVAPSMLAWMRSRKRADTQGG